MIIGPRPVFFGFKSSSVNWTKPTSCIHLKAIHIHFIGKLQYSFIGKFILKENYSIINTIIFLQNGFSYKMKIVKWIFINGYCNFPLKWIFTRWILCRLKYSKWLKVLINFSGDLKHTGKVPENRFLGFRVLRGWSLDQGRYFSGSDRARWIEQNQLVVSI